MVPITHTQPSPTPNLPKPDAIGLQDNSTATHPVALFDLPGLLKRFRNNRTFIAKLLAAFGQEAAQHRDSIVQAHAAAALPELRRAAHKLKGAGLNVNATDLSNLAARLEEMLITEHLDALDQIVGQLKQTIDATVAAVPKAVDQVKSIQ